MTIACNFRPVDKINGGEFGRDHHNGKSTYDNDIGRVRVRHQGGDRPNNLPIE